MNGSITLLVSAVVVDAKNRILLTSHGPTWTWHLPDGAPLAGETLVEALKRSFKEDLGVLIVPEERPCLVSETVTKTVHYVTLHFRAELSDPKAAFSPGPGISVIYVRPADIAGRRLSRTTAEALARVLNWAV